MKNTIVPLSRQPANKRNPRITCFIGLLLLGVLFSMGCSQKPLSPKGKLQIAIRFPDPSLDTIAATLPGLSLNLALRPEFWLQRYRNELAAESVANLYVSEWNRDLFNLIHSNNHSDTAVFWKRTWTANSAPTWLSSLRYGPKNGFVPSAAYVWGLFIHNDAAEGTSTISSKPVSSLEELESTFAERKALNQTPIALGSAFGWPGAAWFTMLDLRMNGSEAVWERYEGKRPFNDEGAKAVLRKLGEWRDKGWFSPDAGTAGLVDATKAVENGSAYCSLLGAYGMDRFSASGAVSFIPFPGSPGSENAEVASLTGFFIPKESSSLEAAMAFSDAYIKSGSPGHTSDSYRVPLVVVLKADKKDENRIVPVLKPFKALQASLLAKATTVVPAFDRAVSPQAMQDSIGLWSAFFTPGGPEADGFADRLQAVMGRSLP